MFWLVLISTKYSVTIFSVACDCHPIGSKGTSCNKNSGQCSCRRRVQGRTCDDCEPSFMLTTRGCRLCRCNKDGTVDGTTATCQIVSYQLLLATDNPHVPL